MVTAMAGSGGALGGLGLVLALAACGSSHARPDAEPKPIALSWSGIVDELPAGGVGSGVEVCVPASPDLACATTDTHGMFTLSLPLVPTLQQDFAIAASLPGYLTGVTLGYAGPVGSAMTELGGSLQLWSNEFANELLASKAGFTVPAATTGYIEVNVAAPNMSGTTTIAQQSVPDGVVAAMLPSPHAVAVYVGENGPDPALSSTGNPGVILLGDVAPGRVSIAISHHTAPCSAGSPTVAGDWPPTGSATVDAFVVAGALTTVAVSCP
jgi:hypothetical protein